MAFEHLFEYYKKHELQNFIIICITLNKWHPNIYLNTTKSELNDNNTNVLSRVKFNSSTCVQYYVK